MLRSKPEPRRPIIRVAFVTALLVFLISCGVHRAPAWPMTRVLPSIVHLTLHNAQGFVKGECTAFGISKRTAITAAHCWTVTQRGIGEDPQMFAGETRVTTPLDFGPLDEAGLMVVRADRDTFIPMRLGQKPVIGEEIAMVGHGFGAPQPLIWTGVVVSTHMLAPGETEPYIMFVSPGSIEGMSGSPIVNRLGEVVGVTMGGFTDPLQNISWGVEYDVLKTVWKRWAE